MTVAFRCVLSCRLCEQHWCRSPFTVCFCSCGAQPALLILPCLRRNSFLAHSCNCISDGAEFRQQTSNACVSLCLLLSVNSMVTVKVVVGSRGLWSMSRLDSIQDSRLLHRIVSLLLGSRVLLFLHVYWLSWKCYHGCELRCRCTHQWSTFPSILLGRTLSPCQQSSSPCQQTIGTTGR